MNSLCKISNKTKIISNKKGIWDKLLPLWRYHKVLTHIRINKVENSVQIPTTWMEERRRSEDLNLRRWKEWRRRQPMDNGESMMEDKK